MRTELVRIGNFRGVRPKGDVGAWPANEIAAIQYPLSGPPSICKERGS